MLCHEQTLKDLIGNIIDTQMVNDNVYIFWIESTTRQSTEVAPLIVYKSGFELGTITPSLTLRKEEFESERGERLLVNTEKNVIAILGREDNGKLFLDKIFEMEHGLEGMRPEVGNDFRALVFEKAFPNYTVKFPGYIVMKKVQEGSSAKGTEEVQEGSSAKVMKKVQKG